MVNYTTPSSGNMNTPEGRASMFGQSCLALKLVFREENIRIVMETSLDVLDGKSIKEFVRESTDNYDAAYQLFKDGKIDPNEILNSETAVKVASKQFEKDVLSL